MRFIMYYVRHVARKFNLFSSDDTIGGFAPDKWAHTEGKSLHLLQQGSRLTAWEWSAILVFQLSFLLSPLCMDLHDGETLWRRNFNYF